MNKKIRMYLWVGYPLAVVLLILFSYKLIFTGAKNRISESFKSKRLVEEQQVLINRMKDNLQKLAGMNETRMTDELKGLLEVVPASKKAWLLAHEIVKAASEAAGGWKEYNGTIGEVKEASEEANLKTNEQQLLLTAKLELVDIEVLGKFVKIMYSYLPLAKVNQAEWTPDTMSVVVEGAWAPWKKAEFSPEIPYVLPGEGYSQVMKKLEGLSKIETATGSGEETGEEGPISPF
jgi:hypothetical protein